MEGSVSAHWSRTCHFSAENIFSWSTNNLTYQGGRYDPLSSIRAAYLLQIMRKYLSYSFEKIHCMIRLLKNKFLRKKLDCKILRNSSEQNYSGHGLTSRAGHAKDRIVFRLKVKFCQVNLSRIFYVSFCIVVVGWSGYFYLVWYLNEMTDLNF